MNSPIRFDYAKIESGSHQATMLAYVPLTLHNQSKSLTISALLDTGSTVNVVPYAVGLQLGFVWEEQTIPVSLTGSLARVSARGIIVTGEIKPFAPVELAFAWTRATDVPVILGQVNFFWEFDVCFFRSQSSFEVKPKNGV